MGRVQQMDWWAHMAEKRFGDYLSAIDQCGIDVRDGSCGATADACGRCPLGPREELRVREFPETSA